VFCPSRFRHVALTALVAALVAVWPAPSEAQYRGRHRVVVTAGFGFPYYSPYYYPYYDPWYWWGPYPYYPLINYSTSSLRVQVKPNDALVYVDGYLAGEVDRFDNIFQRLQVRPGGHEITIYHEQYRTFRQQMHFAPGGDQKLELQLEPLAPGEVAEEPAPPAQPAQASPAAVAGEPEGQTTERAVHPKRVREGTLSMRVVPGDAEILIGGESWALPPGQERLTTPLPVGRYTLEVRKAGYEPYVQDIRILRNTTLRLTVALDPARR
jgi:hypothetical protein